MPDPTLKQAMTEIRTLCQRYRIGAQVTLVSRSHAEFGYLFPDWSVIQPERDSQGHPGIRLRSYEAYYGSKAAQRQALEESLHCLYQIRDLAGRAFLMFENLCTQVEERCDFDIEHRPYSGFEPHEEEPLL